MSFSEKFIKTAINVYLIFIFGVFVGYAWSFYHYYNYAIDARKAYNTKIMQYVVPHDITKNKTPKVGLKQKTFG